MVNSYKNYRNVKKERAISNYKLLAEDKLWIEKRLKYLQGKIQDLGPEFHEALNQSSETWHDNAPFDAVRDKQSLIYAEYSHLKYVLLGSEKVAVPKGSKVSIGHKVSVHQNELEKKYFIAGDWSHRVGRTDQNGFMVISCKTPIALELLGKPVGAETKYGLIATIE